MILPTTNPILIAAALCPAIVLFRVVYKADRLEKESGRLLGSLVIAGVIATAFAIVTERIGSFLLGMFVPPDTVRYNVLMYFVVVACSEEGFKYLLLKRKTWRTREFNCQFDGIVYAVFVSLGFAACENLSYVAMYGLRTALLRAVTAVPGHACFGVFMGSWYGMAKRYDNAGNVGASKLCRTLAFALPVLMHGAYDFIASTDTLHSAWIFFVFVAAMFLLAFGTVKRRSGKDRYI